MTPCRSIRNRFTTQFPVAIAFVSPFVIWSPRKCVITSKADERAYIQPPGLT